MILAAVAAATDGTSIPAFANLPQQGVRLSLYLALFNMLPVPPLDGSKLLLAARIPMIVYVELSRFGFMLLIVVMAYTNIGRWMSAWSYDAAQAIFSVL